MARRRYHVPSCPLHKSQSRRQPKRTRRSRSDSTSTSSSSSTSTSTSSGTSSSVVHGVIWQARNPVPDGSVAYDPRAPHVHPAVAPYIQNAHHTYPSYNAYSTGPTRNYTPQGYGANFYPGPANGAFLGPPAPRVPPAHQYTSVPPAPQYTPVPPAQPSGIYASKSSSSGPGTFGQATRRAPSRNLTPPSIPFRMPSDPSMMKSRSVPGQSPVTKPLILPGHEHLPGGAPYVGNDRYSPGVDNGRYIPGAENGRYNPGAENGRYNPGAENVRYVPGNENGRYGAGRDEPYLSSNGGRAVSYNLPVEPAKEAPIVAESGGNMETGSALLESAYEPSIVLSRAPSGVFLPDFRARSRASKKQATCCGS